MRPPHTMRAWLSKEVGRNGLVLDVVPRPQIQSGEMLVAVEAAALNFTDLLMLEDKFQVRLARPFVPGVEIAGTVVACRPEGRFSVGDKVASEVRSGGFAEFAIVREEMAIRISPSLDVSQAAALPVAYTASVVALTESTCLRSGETVLVHGAAGGVGLAALQIAKSLGARVLATAGSRRKRELAEQQGADHVIDYTRPDWNDCVKKLTRGRGVDVVFDPVGGDVTAESLRCLAWNGRLLIVGFASGSIPNIPANRLLLKRASAIGVYWNHARDGAMMTRVNDRLNEMLRNGAIAPLVDSGYKLEELGAALQTLASRQSVGKLVIRIGHQGNG